MVITDSLKQWKKDLIKSQTKLKEIKKEYNQKYNSVLGSKKDIYHAKQNIKIMSFQKQFEQVPEKLVKTLLRPKEVKKLQLLVDRGNYPLIAIVKSDDNDSFCGYYPLNAGIEDGFTVHRTKEGLDILENFCGGG